MKKTITLFSLLFVLTAQSQIVADFESFTLTANSFYKDTNSVDWQTTAATFSYEWTKGSFPYWSGGFSYTNVQDSSNGTYTNLYGCIPLKGYNNSDKYVTGKDKGVIKMNSPYNHVNGFYITNTTYACKTVKNGDGFSKKFGGTSGNDPDWFKVTVKGYQGGTMKADSVEFYLADYRFSNNSQDYIVKNWQWVNTTGLGVVDSIKFFMYSTDVGSFGMNTPAFFSLDNFTTSQIAGINEMFSAESLKMYPNPALDHVYLEMETRNRFYSEIKIYDLLGAEVKSLPVNAEAGTNLFRMDLGDLSSGVYFMNADNRKFKFIKN